MVLKEKGLMEKRRSPRYSVSLDALVHPQAGRSWLCSIKDFCDAGMLLVEQSGTRTRRSGASNTGDVVGIHFSVPAEPKDRHFRLEGKIVRVMDSGVGINFPRGMPEDALRTLMDYANASSSDESDRPARKDPPRQPTAAKDLDLNKSAKSQQPDPPSPANSEISPADSKKIIAAVRREVVKVIPEMCSAFFGYMDKELLAMASNSRNNAEQSEYFAAMSNLEKTKKNVSQSFLDEVLDHIDHPKDLKALLKELDKAEAERKKEGASKVKLSLVNTEEFEDWLALANLVSRAERAFEQPLNEIQTRLGMLVDSWAHKEANPVGPSVMCHAFDQAIRPVEMTKASRQKVYSGMEARMVPLYRKLYVNVTKMLEDTGVFPDMDEDYISPVTPKHLKEDEPAKEPEANEDTEAEVDEAEHEEEDTGPAQRPRGRRDPDGTRQRRSSGPGRSAQQQRERPTPRDDSRGRPETRPQQAQTRPQQGQTRSRQAPESGPAAAPSSRSRVFGEAINSIYSTVRSLMNMQQSLEGDFAEELGDEDMVELDEVQEMLSSLQPKNDSWSGERIPVRRQIQERVSQGDRPRRLAPQVRERLGVVENLVDSIEHDAMLSSSAKDWIRQLEVTLDKVAAQKGEEFLDVENPHESLEVLNQLAELGGSESGSVQRKVEDIIGNIRENYDSNPDVFKEALGELKPLVERQSRAFTGNVQRTVKSSEGQQTLINAQRAVVDEMNQRLAGREIPEILLKLLVPGWRNLLVNTHLRQGQNSDDWKQHVRALEQVFEHLDEASDPTLSPDYMPPEELIGHIEKGLDAIAFEPGQRAPLIKSLRSILLEGQGAEKMSRVAMPTESVAETLGFGEIQEKDARRREIRDNQADNPEWERWLERATRLHVGEWLEFNDGPEQPQIAIVAWTSDDNSSLVFVNRRGIKTHDLTVEEVAMRLMDASARILEESDIPLTDRASHRMLQNMHNQLTHQATHDDLTGLVNRKEFERELQRALGIARRNDVTHLVAYMDLDQFKVINNASGHDAGDALLKEIGNLFVRQLGDSKYVLSRLGGDEFGLLIENCETDAGMSVVKQLSDAVRQLKFGWQGDSYTLTTSCGVVLVDSATEGVSAIMRDADAACISAKEAGRDRIQLFEFDSEMERRRDVMEFVSRIDAALEADRFVLNCQKISPIDTESEEDAHYEILLTVLDENGEPLPPQDFIVAAETYNRMGQIDRWVIRNAFRFIANNILKLEGLGAFSINISGNSLTEEGFMEFVLDQFNETRLPTSKICFEITETSAIGSLDEAIDFMERMKIIGVKFSLDDFGTGLSSYSYLRNLPVDYLKIDGIFVKDLKTNPNDYAVVKSINEIGHFMGKKTIAEYVEDEEIMEILREIGVDFAQGYGIEKKIPITELLR